MWTGNTSLSLSAAKPTGKVGCDGDLFPRIRGFGGKIVDELIPASTIFSSGDHLAHTISILYARVSHSGSAV